MEARSKGKSRLPLKEIDEKNKQRIRELNGEFLNLYRVLGHHAKLLSAWIEFAYTLRRDCTTTRTLRELMILRGAQLEGSAYEWHQHRRWARQQGVPPEQIEDLFFWRESPRFSPSECAALALTEAILHGDVPDDVYAELAKHFSSSEIIELGSHFGAAVVDLTPDTVTLEVTGSGEKIEKLIGLLQEYGIREVARSGSVAMTRGT